MLLSPKNSLFGTLAIGAGFVAAVGFSVFASRYFPAMARNESLLDVWRCIIASIAILLVKLLYGSMPRIRLMWLHNRANRITQLQMTTPLWWRS
jgi:hypothetical protein